MTYSQTANVPDPSGAACVYYTDTPPPPLAQFAPQ